MTRTEFLKCRRAQGKRRRKMFVAKGLRTDGKPHVPPKSCGCRNGRCYKCMKPGDKGYLSPKEVAAMYREYQSGATQTALGIKYGHNRKSIHEIFIRRGLKLKPVTQPILGYGVKIPEPAYAEIGRIISGLDRFCIPDCFKLHWRHWTLDKRMDYIRRLRQRFPSNLPTGPFSNNVIPFNYGTSAARSIVNQTHPY
jgi:hypothetical protein